jgi:hypothetical protein
MVAIALLPLFMLACRKQFNPADTETTAAPADAAATQPELPGAETNDRVNPYSLGNIRDTKDVLSQIDDPHAQSLGKEPIPDKDIQLYVRFTLDKEDQYKAIENEKDLQVHNYPLGQTTYAASQSDVVDNDLFYRTYATPTTLYAVVPVGRPLPNVPYEVLDSIYVPKDNEPYLDFFAHLVTHNIDRATMDMFKGRYTELHNLILEGEALGWFPPAGDPAERRWRLFGAIRNIVNQVFGVVSNIFNGVSNLAGWGKDPEGFIRVADNAVNLNVPVQGIRVSVVHWGSVHSAITDANGYFKISRKFWFGSLVTETFDNSRCKIKQFDTHGGWVLTSVPAYAVLNAATHVSGFYSAAQMATFNEVHSAHKQVRFWCLITNAVHEFRSYAAGFGIGQPSKLTVAAHWANSTGAASAPMLGYIGLYAAGIDFVAAKLGFPGFVIPPYPNFFSGFLPDITIKQAASAGSAENFGEIKQTLFHEMGHAIHYFKVGNAYWLQNISLSVTSGGGYGSNNSSSPGNFFSLTEGWADYIGHLFVSQRYPNYRINNVATNNTYLRQLEVTQFFFNNFIPRGLFYDLTDNNPFGNEINDQVNTYTIAQLYNALQPDVKSIPQFRTRLQTQAGTNVNNGALFTWYGF